jgi:DNA (cytosine-5)-methyltransferase 1
MSKPRLLDLFCGAGGAAEGYRRAGFEIVGVDIAEQPDYPFEFLKQDALWMLEVLVGHGSIFPETTMSSPTDAPRYWLDDFQAIHASPPCPAYSSLRSLHPDADHPRLYERVRDWLRATELPYVIENVIGAPYASGVMLCGSMFGLPIRRHRNFETSFLVLGPECRHDEQGELVGIYGASDGPRKPDGGKHPGNKRGPRQATTAEAREIMEMPWATKRKNITDAVPPCFTELIGANLMAEVPGAAIEVLP